MDTVLLPFIMVLYLIIVIPIFKTLEKKIAIIYSFLLLMLFLIMYLYVNSEYFDYYNYPFDFMKPKTS
jgi:hypothetical protein